MRISLPDQYSETEVKEVLRKLGSPVEVVASYQDTPHFLIGPENFEQYTRTIKLIIPWAVLITVIVQIIEKIVLYSGEEALLTTIITAFAGIVVAIIAVLFHILFWVTVIFIIKDRSGAEKISIPFLKDTKPWSPDDLVQIKRIPKDKIIPVSDTIFSLLGILIFSFVYWNAYRLLGIYTTNDNGKL